MAKALAIAHAQVANMQGCQLSDQAITLITLRVNTGQNVASLARQLKMNRSHAYNIIASPTGQELVARLARAALGTAASTGLRTLEQLCTSKDAHVALQAAQDLMERAGLGHSQRSAAPQATSFAFNFAERRKDEA
jgi:plasmid maintenance system antidote protein VapI